ncbi:prephenate dehydrogenase [Thalassobacillus pellis]|uniref:prephenate dehydrogenase n=1 Tax=Thalassobacillus pellis TaxID=748008 RepID=UPI001961BE98|nr:prephenate dehydrogenase [Thalassobacillus pellis]MBM7552470.1 prephenate dehydrogenase [Thalassobacillus pellis]
MKESVMIVGLGLIGGSLALGLSKQKKYHIIGCDSDISSKELAKEQGAISESTDFESGVKQADYLILATPIPITIDYLKKLDKLKLTKKLIVTDVSSVKEKVMETADSITNPHVSFVGGHPMAGSHKQGFTAAKSHLFENAIYVLTPSRNASDRDVEYIKKILISTKARFLTFNREEHDEMTAVVSHFPHLIASSLVHQARHWQETHPYLEDLAAGGFRDITRIASSNPVLWKDIFFQNRSILLSMIDDWVKEMEEVKQLLSSENHEATQEYLSTAKQYRDGLPVKKRGAIPSFYDIYVDITDQPGALLHVMGHLAEREISIKNIEILEVREGITGVLRISFQSSREQKASKLILEAENYEVTIQQ